MLWWPSHTAFWLGKGPPGLQVSRLVPSMKPKTGAGSPSIPTLVEIMVAHRCAFSLMRVTSPGQNRCRQVLKMKQATSSMMLQECNAQTYHFE